MPQQYKYKVRDKSGELILGTVRGEDESSVESYLESLDLIPIQIRPKRDFSIRKILRFGGSKPKSEDVVLITRKMSTLYRAGIPILKSLEIIAEQYEDAMLGDVLLSIRDDLERGEHLSDCMAKHPTVFTHIYVSSVRAAEASGKLDIVLDSLAESMEQELVTREEVKKALRYPITVMIAISVAFVILTIFVVPKFTQFYASYDADLPAPTRLIVAISNIFKNLWYIIFPGITLVIYGLRKLLKNPAMKPYVDSFALKIPIIGTLLVKSALSRFSHVLSVLVASGTPLIQSLDIVKEAVGNHVIGNEIGKMSEGMREGRTLAECKPHMKHFPKLALSLMHVGLESGSLELTLKEIRRFFDREVQYMSSRLTSLLEPFVLIIVAGMVLVLALAIFLPMWNLISVFKS